MANTVIKLKKSSEVNKAPTSLEYGEIAINYADGRIYYKNTAGQIAYVSGGDIPFNFGAVNVAGQLLIADTQGDYLTIINGDNIDLSANIFSDSFTITANLKSAFDAANQAGVISNSAFGKSNTSFTVANAAYDKANAANVLAFNTGIGANNYTNAYGLQILTDAYGYANGTVLNAARDYTNTSVGASNNYAGLMVNAANAWANTKLSNTDGALFNGSLNVKNTLYAYDVVIANSMIANISGNVNNLRVTNNVFIGGSITNVTQLMFNTSTNITPTVPGALTWSQDDSTLHFDMDTPSNVIGHIGQDLFYYVKNQTGSTITKGTVVRFAGTLGASSRLLVAPATANNQYPSKYVVGVAAANIADGADGFVISQGKLRGINTSMFSQGDILYVSSTTPGAFQNTMPTAPNNKITIAAVVNSHNIQGALEIRLTLGSKLNEDELVELNGLANGDIITYISSKGRFENSGVLVSAFGVANSGFNKANTVASDLANTAVAANNYAGAMANSVNGAFATADSGVRLYVNTSVSSSNNYAGAMANSANVYANSTYATQTTVATNATSANNYAGVMANGAGTIANGAFAAANQAGVIANAAFNEGNVAYTAVNSAFGVINAAFGVANNAYTATNGAAAFAFANGVSTNTTAAFNHSNLTYNAVNSAFAVINAAYTSSNADYVLTNAVFTQSNTDNVRLSAAYVSVNAAFTSANTAGASANTAGLNANQAGVIANAAFGAANQAGLVANNANTYANSTYVKKAGDTITGDLVVQGNLTTSGVVTYANTQTLLIGDAIITLNNDIPAAVAPSEDAGIEVKRGSSANVSILWREGNDNWTITNDGTTWYSIATNTDVSSVATAANNYSGFMANAGNAFASTIVAANLVTATAYTNTSTTAANNYSGFMANAGNAFASTIVAANLIIARAYTNTSVLAANAYADTKLANTTVTLAGALTTTGSITANNLLTLTPFDGSNEGGQINLIGAGSNPNWTIDSYSTVMRIFTGGVGSRSVSLFNANGGANTVDFYVTGQVSVGGATPLDKLHVQTTGRGTDGMLLSSTTGGNLKFAANVAVGSWNGLVQNNDKIIMFNNGNSDTVCGLSIVPWSNTTSGLRMDHNGNVSIGVASTSFDFDVRGDTRIANHLFQSSSMEINNFGTGNRYAYIDFRGDDTYTDYSLRIIRDNTGANAASWIQHRGRGDLNLYTWESANIVFSTAASEIVRFTASNYVGIGDSNPDTKLVVLRNTNSNTYNDIVSFRQGNNPSGSLHSRILFSQITRNNMMIESGDESNVKGNLLLQPYGGNVAIGVTSSAYTFQVFNSSSDVDYYISRFWSAAAVSGTSNTLIRIEKGSGYGGTIGGYITQGVGSGLVLGTLNAGTQLSTMWITNGGNVGIGTSSPATKLDVAGGIRSKTATQYNGYSLENATNVVAKIYGQTAANDGGSFELLSGGVTKILFSAGGGDNYVNNGGNFGVGTAPSYRLHVAGGASWFNNNSGDVQIRANVATFSHTVGSNFTAGSDPGDSLRNTSFITKGSTRPVIVTLRNADNNSAFWDIVADGNTNRFYFQRYNASVPVMTFDGSEKVGIATASPVTRLHVGAKVTDDASYTYDTNTLMVVHQTATGTSVLNDPKTVMMLGRQGTGGQAFGAAAQFNLSRYENDSVNSRTRLDFTLAHGSFIAANTTVMTMLSSGNVGIGNTAPLALLSVGGGSLVDSAVPVQISTASTSGFAYFGANRAGGYGALFGYDNAGTFGGVTIRNVVSAGTSGDAISFAVNNTTEAMRITGTGRVGIGTTTPGARLQLNPIGNLNAGVGVLDMSQAALVIGTTTTGIGFDSNQMEGNNTPIHINYTSGQDVTLCYGGGNVAIGLNTTTYKLQVNGSFAATTKSFVIDHPTKPGKKLRYGSLEGPENGVYIRGKIDGKVIDLPDYWTGLVDEDSITVQLTAIGHSQKPYVVEIKNNRVHIDTENHTQPYCFYHIYAERNDVDKLVVEFDE